MLIKPNTQSLSKLADAYLVCGTVTGHVISISDRHKQFADMPGLNSLIYRISLKRYACKNFG